MGKRVSIIVPVFNTYEYLGRCLESLVKQTLDGIEVIVVNDGSTDRSQVVIDEYSARYPDIVKGFVKENSGVSETRNFGIEKATGEYLGFVDSDDFVDPDYYELMYKKAEETDADVVCAPIAYAFFDHVTKNYYEKKHFGKKARDDGYILLKGNALSWNKIYRTRFWKDNGFRYPVQWYEDSALIYNVLLMANKVECVNIPFYNYTRDREDSIVNSFDMRIYDVFKSTDSIISFFKEQGVFEELYDTVEHLCVRHIFGRLEMLHGCASNRESRRFASFAVDYLNKNFKEWRNCDFLRPGKKAGRVEKGRYFELTHIYTLKRYVSGKYLPFCNIVDSRKREQNKRGNQLDHGAKPNIKNVRKYGGMTLRDVQVQLGKKGINSFADEQTCLALLREAKLPNNEASLYLGIVAEPEKASLIRITLERLGYELNRQYIYKDKIAKETYRLKGIEIVINYYYKSDNNKMMSWHLYRNPDCNYTDNQMDAAEKTFSLVGEYKTITTDGLSIIVPQNTESLMEEQFGPEWETVNIENVEQTNHETLDEKGFTYACYYKKTGNKNMELPKRVLINGSGETVEWEKVYECADKGYDPVIIGSKTEKSINKHPRVQIITNNNVEGMICYSELDDRKDTLL